jgi:hypothetical protein
VATDNKNWEDEMVTRRNAANSNVDTARSRLQQHKETGGYNLCADIQRYKRDEFEDRRVVICRLEHGRLSNVVVDGLSGVLAAGLRCPCVLCTVSRIFNGNEIGLFTREPRGASGFCCVKFIEN